MEYIIDVHTHHKRCNAVINASARDFSPQAGYYYSVGIHPWEIKDIDIEEAFNAVANAACNCSQIIAIGECGLDAVIDTPLEEQIFVLEKHITLSESLNKPLILHCVRRTAEIIHLHNKYSPKMPWILHGFRGNINVLANVLNTPNIYISIGEKFNAEAVKSIPADRLLLETDESELAINAICENVAIARNESVQDLRTIVNQNIVKIFGEGIIL